MKVTNVYSSRHRTAARQASEQQVRDMFQNWRPGPEELLASGRWHDDSVVEGQQQFWQAIREVRAFREAQGLTLKDISDRCGIDVASLSKLENGKPANPTLFTMLLYVGAVGERLNFSVGARLPTSAKPSEIREAETLSNGTSGTAAKQPKRAKGRLRGDNRG